MKSVYHSQFGPPETLQLQEIEIPTPKAKELLIKIHTSTVTSSDCNMRNLTFAPQWARLPFRLFVVGIHKPRIKRLGMEMAGEVTTIGKAVTKYKVGDAVFGSVKPGLGTHAEYVCMHESSKIMLKPEQLPWDEAACLSLAANTALYFIRDLAALDSGQHILINGGSGAIGSFAIQLAKYYGAEVSGVSSSKNANLLTSLGADHVLDYEKENVCKGHQKYDVIFDAVAKLKYKNCKDALTDKGIFLSSLPSLDLIGHSIASAFSKGKKVRIGDAVPKVENLEFLNELILKGKLKAVIGMTCDLKDIVAAFNHAESGHKTGNLIINCLNRAVDQ